MVEEEIKYVPGMSAAERKRQAELTHNSPMILKKVAKAKETLEKYPIDFGKLRSKS